MYSWPHSRQNASGIISCSRSPGTYSCPLVLMYRSDSGASETATAQPPLKNWCRRKANTGKPSGSRTRPPASRAACSAAWHWLASTPVVSASSAAAPFGPVSGRGRQRA